ncbi:uncharacterized protein APUU_50418A [Aspergillus puulaauensis]|uniref:F-box domain-containing protein n=1 Tax=Aspergillus puulaauensis TaxID=1220207 RepID=A0A7R8AP88_9EURO|nr:uncharacterized protein APUU_50418A [Aspergillus puulaauensis]BCS25707.1 hypothetical protein APUU_50418A [Aspergillus puulaauensis]
MLQLPTEIQLLIIQQLDHENLSNLALTSHCFCTLATPLLYQNLDNSIHNLDRVVDTLGRNPSLREYPRSLRIEAWDPNPAREGEIELIDPEEEDADYWGYRTGLLCRLAKAASPSKEEGVSWARDIRAEDSDAWIALLLMFTPRLTRLSVQFPEAGRWVQRVIEWTLRRQFADELPLQHVQDVYISARWFEFQGDNERVTQWTLMFLGLPALRRIATDGLSGDDEETAITCSSSVTHIAIDCCKGLQHLDRLVANCPKLESYRHWYHPQSSCRHILDPRDFYPALLRTRDTLKELWLDIFPGFVIENEYGVHWPSFRDFTVLELLHVPIFLLGDYKDNPANLEPIFPSSLKSLHVTQVDKWTLSSLLKSLLDYIPTTPSQFRELIIANMTIPTFRSATMAAVEMHTRTPDLTPAERAAPVIRYASELPDLCRQRNIRFGIYGDQDQSLECWTLPDPFEYAR